MIKETLQSKILYKVDKPGQYLGLEWGIYKKNWQEMHSRMAIVYPDLYELGMSNFGIKILYNIVNNQANYMCDRAYSVMPDMEEQMQKHDIGLWGWESYQELKDFDFLGFSLAYELCYTNIFSILNLCKIPFQTKERVHNHPLIFAGGPAVFNPEPMANYFDFYIIGDGEELIVEIQDSLIETKKNFLENNPSIKTEIMNLGISEDLAFRELKNFPLSETKSKELRLETLENLAKLQGIYVPSLYEPDPLENYLPKPVNNSVPYPVSKRITQNLDDFNQPVAGPVPVIQTIQDKQVLEIRRGCDRGCRFCQVGYTYLPVRERSPEDLYRKASESIKKSGYEDMTLLSLSASDYTCLTEAARAINNEHAQNGISLNMPSQRADRFNVHLADEVSQSRKSGMTFAPEAGTEKMRKIINKGLSQEEIFRAIKGSYQKGWNHIKLYFMIGLPFEDDSDLDGILDILTWSINMSKQLQKDFPKKYKKQLQLTCTISTFVPKTFTAFQWFSQCSKEEFKRKQEYLREGLFQRKIQRKVKLNCTEPELALIEAVLSRADRRWGDVIERVWQKGSRMDSWSEYFNLERWQSAAHEFGFDLDHEATRLREPGSKQAWDAISIGFTDKFLIHEWQQAVDIVETIPCTENKCHACGVCFNLDVTNIVAEDLSQANPFVKEIDKEKRKQSCANFEELYNFGQGIKKQKEIITGINELVDSSDEEYTGQPIVVVKDTVAQQKLRVRLSKLGDFKYVGHLDFQKFFERALRRTGLAVVHSTGFNQRMKISWGPALPLFFESAGEYVEFELAERFDDLEILKKIINDELVIDAQIVDILDISDNKKLSINKIESSLYMVEADFDLDKQKIENCFGQEKIEISKKSKKTSKTKIIDLKENLIRFEIKDHRKLLLELKAFQRPDEFMNILYEGEPFSIKKLETKLAEPIILTI